MGALWCQAGGAAPKTEGADAAQSSQLQVVVLNLPWSVTWQTLKDHFANTGKVVRADVVLDDSGRSRYAPASSVSPHDPRILLSLPNHLTCHSSPSALNTNSTHSTQHESSCSMSEHQFAMRLHQSATCDSRELVSGLT